MKTSGSERDSHFHSMVDVPGLTHELFDFNSEGSNMIPEETKEWLEAIGAREFKRPMKWHDPNGILFSEEYLRETPLDQIKAGYESIPKKNDDTVEVAKAVLELMKDAYKADPISPRALEGFQR